ncbi:MAG: ATP-binding protein [Bacteroidota bacterium]
MIRSQFRQLFTNLVSNSLKFSLLQVIPRIKIRSRIRRGSKIKDMNLLPEWDYCHIVYTDNGMGFDPQYSKLIFDVFQHLHSPGDYEGTGMGLAICRKIVENHKGVITATGKPGKGARFDIYIPVTNVDG